MWYSTKYYIMYYTILYYICTIHNICRQSINTIYMLILLIARILNIHEVKPRTDCSATGDVTSLEIYNVVSPFAMIAGLELLNLTKFLRVLSWNSHLLNWIELLRVLILCSSASWSLHSDSRLFFWGGGGEEKSLPKKDLVRATVSTRGHLVKSCDRLENTRMTSYWPLITCILPVCTVYTWFHMIGIFSRHTPFSSFPFWS